MNDEVYRHPVRASCRASGVIRFAVADIDRIPEPTPVVRPGRAPVRDLPDTRETPRQETAACPASHPR